MRQAVDIARKLELTSIALGCLTRKELCTAFVRVNPNTLMSLQNCYNWQSGRSVPRSFGVFEDWAAVVGMAEGPHFVMSSSLSEFARVLGDRFALPDQLLEAFGRPAEVEPPRLCRPARARPSPGTAPRCCGAAFSASSPSWSPPQRGRLLLGAIAIDLEGGSVTARYRETILGRPVVFAGGGRTDGRTCQLTLQCEASGGTYLMSLHLPALPGNLTGGVFSGNALYDPNSHPTASAILLLRNHALPLAELEESSEYLDADETALAGRLEQLGYGRDRALAAERQVLRLLTGGDAGLTVSMPRDTLGQAAVLLDQRRLDAAGGI